MNLTVFTSNSKGGVLQLAQVIASTAKGMGCSVQLAVPYNAEIPEYKGNIYKYTIRKSMNPYSKDIKSITRSIISKSDALIICDDALIGSRVAISAGKQIPTLIIIHDVRPHYTNRVRLIKRKIKIIITEKGYKSVHTICLLSQNSYTDFIKLYPDYKDKTISIKLGAHLTTFDKVKPPEITDMDNYALFFGRIDTYKGIEKLIKAYNNANENLPPLIIAGSGDISEIKKESCESIVFVNRYIMDKEMNWLFSHCSFVVLPYTQATQSGIIPIAYFYGKPVLVSDLPGLTENVLEHNTGEIIRTEDELIEKILYIWNNTSNYKQIINYYKTNYDWESNVRILLNTLFRNCNTSI